MEEPKVEGQPASPAPEPQEGQTPPTPGTPALPDKFQGKSAEEIASAYLEVERKLGAQSDEVGQLRNELAYMKGMVEQGFQKTQAQEATPQVGTRWNIDPDTFYQKPVDSVDLIVQQRIKEYETQRQQEEQKREEAEAQANYLRGREGAFRQSPKLFEGIEKDVENLVYASYKNKAVNKWSLSDPETWTTAAQLVWLKRKDFNRIIPQSPKPVSAVQTENPQAGRPLSIEEMPIEVSQELRDFWKAEGLSEKEGMEQLKREMEAKAQGLNRSYK